MKKVAVLPCFERDVKKFTHQKKEKLKEALTAFNRYLQTGEHPHGLRFKKIGPDNFEFRIDLSLRVVMKQEDNIYYLVCAGNHEDVKRYLSARKG